MIRDVRPQDFQAILDLNLAWEHFLSPMTPDRLAELHAMADYHRLLDDGEAGVAAFLMAFRAGRPYDSVNYRWFDARHERFLYIDRVVVATAHQGRGLGRHLYEDLFSHARRQGITQICCEFDLDPPNPRSRTFHERFGFEEVGVQRDENTGKRVSLRLLRLGP